MPRQSILLDFGIVLGVKGKMHALKCKMNRL